MQELCQLMTRFTAYIDLSGAIVATVVGPMHQIGDRIYPQLGGTRVFIPLL